MELKERLIEQFENVHGELTIAAEILIDKYIYYEGLKKQATASLDEQGLRERYNVAKYQTGLRENKSLGMLVKIDGAQMRILKDLGLLPSRRKKAEDEEDEDVGDINEY